MNILSSPRRFLPTACCLAALLLSPMAALGQDQTVTGNLSVTGTVDIDANTLTFGTQGTSPGLSLTYSDAAIDTLTFYTNRNPSSWLWAHTSAIAAMRLTGNHELVLYKADGSTAGLTFTPATHSISLGATTLYRDGTSGALRTNGAFTIDGALEAPSLKANNGSLTGGASGLTLNSGGTDQNVTLTPSGNGYTLLNGKVGIGTSTPTVKLHVVGDTKLQGNAEITGTLSATAVTVTNGTVTGGSTGLTLSSGGSNQDITINAGNTRVTVPLGSEKTFSVGNSAGDVLKAGFVEGGGYRFRLSLTGFLGGTNYTFATDLPTTNKNLYINRPTDGAILFRENDGTSQLVLAAGGNLGIGTTTPAATLSINSKSTTGSGNPSVLLSGQHNSERIQIRSSGGDAVFGAFQSAGTLTSPTTLAAGAGAGYFQFGGYDGVIWTPGAWIKATTAEAWTASTRGTHLSFSTTPIGGTTITERLRIDSVGNVGLGTTTPSVRLDVVGAANISGNATVGGTLNAATLQIAGQPFSSANLLQSTGTYANPTWLTSLSASKLTAGTLPASAMPAYTGDVTAAAGGTTLTLANSGVTAGTYGKVTVDAKGRVTAGASLASSDVTTALTYTPYNATNPANYIAASGAPVQSVFGRTGAVTLQSTDISSALATTPTALAATTVTVSGALTGTGSLALNAGGSNQNVTLTPTGTGATLLNGNVGIGTSVPAKKLDVTGAARVHGDLQVTGVMLVAQRGDLSMGEFTSGAQPQNP